MKLLVSDYDGTINFKGEVNKEDINALKSFHDQGNIISIASSRPYKSLHAEVTKFNIPFNLLVCNDGNAIFEGNSLIEQNRLNIEELRTLRELINKLPRGEIVPCDAYGFYSLNPVYYQVTLFDNYPFAEFEKMFNDNGLSIDYFLNLGMIFSKRRQKNDSARFASQKYGIDISQAYTIGDGDNDYSMLEEFNGYTLPWCSQKVKKLNLQNVNSVSEVIKRII